MTCVLNSHHLLVVQFVRQGSRTLQLQEEGPPHLGMSPPRFTRSNPAARDLDAGSFLAKLGLWHLDCNEFPVKAVKVHPKNGQPTLWPSKL